MLTNKQIASEFNLLAQLMELHGEADYRVKTYANAYLTLRAQAAPLAEMSREQLKAIKGVGDALSSKIIELVQEGQIKAAAEYLSKTPAGIVELLGIKGLGAKKGRPLWSDLGIETPGELLYACYENRLLTLKGFGEKTQADLQGKLEYYFQSKDKYRYATVDGIAAELLGKLQKEVGGSLIALSGAMRRADIILSELSFVVAAQLTDEQLTKCGLSDISRNEKLVRAIYQERYKVELSFCEAANFPFVLFETTGTPEFVAAAMAQQPDFDRHRAYGDENEVFAALGLPFVAPELREHTAWLMKDSPLSSSIRAVSVSPSSTPTLFDAVPQGLSLSSTPPPLQQLPATLITEGDIRGIIHSHSTYSDGANTLREMATESRDLGYQYLVITDHSQSAFYANGLKEDRVRQQWAEIDTLNEELAPFRIFKGIESDILSDGSLDYPDELLAGFEVVIASIHSNLKMDEAKATERLLRAIAQPYTHILGHPTGRLLLSRNGYPIDHRRVIDACAEHGVAIELNANPYRLDMDYEWIPYAVSKGVKISINPDAHSKAGISDLRYGVLAARKGGLQAEECLNTLTAVGLVNYLLNRKT